MSLQLFQVVWIFLRPPGVICYDRLVLSEDLKNYFKDCCLINSAYLSVFDLLLSQWIMAILSKRCRPDNFESHNSIKLWFTNTGCQRLNFIECESWIKLSWHSCSVWDKHSVYSGKFSVRGCPPFIQKDSVTQIHGLAIYLKEGLPFAWNVSLGNSADSQCFWLALLHSLAVLLLFLTLITFFVIMHHFWCCLNLT